MWSLMEKTPKKTTIYDLAELAGASPSAVSSVLNGTWKKRRISKKLADRIARVAEEQGYAVNAQASLLRKTRSHIIGMIVPKYDNRYFGEIAEQFEAKARAAGYFPVVTCTQRDPDLEFEAAKELVSYQAECLIATGATDPDRISAFCDAAGVQSINLDLPGSGATSVISDNFSGARDLTNLILDHLSREFGSATPLYFVGGRPTDHNTAERLRGFLAAHEDRRITVPEDHILAIGYSADKAATALNGFEPQTPTGIFVNSTISLEGVMRWHRKLPKGAEHVRFGCFDWDPFGSYLPGNIAMVEQDVGTMLDKAFNLIGKPQTSKDQILVPCKLRVFNAPLDREHAG